MIELPNESSKADASGGRRHMRYFRYLFSAIVLITPSQVWAWGCVGHQTVALIAEKHLNAHAAAMVNQLLRGNPIDPALARYCQPVSSDPMVDASTWPDDIRSLHPEYSPWHFIDVPRGVEHGDLDKYCPQPIGCITSALKKELEILESRLSDTQQKVDALRFVIHFVGDIHQPLHDITNNDEGGNCVPVTFFDKETQLRGDPSKENYSPNLHSVWDSFLIERAANGATVSQLADGLNSKFQGKSESWVRGGADLDAWVWEGHRLAEEFSYGKLPQKIAVEQPQTVNSCTDDNNVGARMFVLHEQIADAYQNSAAPIVEEQIARAGIRLAMVLNQIWK
jgi:hypothetical protein